MRHRRMLAPINSIKHYVQMENAVTADAARKTFDFVVAVVSPGVSSTAAVVEGAIIKAVYIEIWIKSNAVAGTEDKFQFLIMKLPSGASEPSFSEMNNLQAYENKKNIFYYSQGVLGDLTTNTIPVFRGWLKLPKGKQRFGLSDKLTIALSTTGSTLNSCGFATYKEYK